MRYICIDKDKFDVVLSDDNNQLDYAINIDDVADYFHKYSLHKIVYSDVLYTLVHEKDKKENIEGTLYSLLKPDPWLVAIAYVMWEGLIQGMTWDIIKFFVLNILKKLKLYGLAPNLTEDIQESDTNSNYRKSRKEIGFSWIEYSDEGEPLREFFLGLKSVYEKKSVRERKKISKKK
ncbi:MAG: hypothetical protein HYZ10_14470 [Ignavibacteriales bacterium]|nr:hypothetical protein [Ignavibacteriales bacterium]